MVFTVHRKQTSKRTSITFYVRVTEPCISKYYSTHNRYEVTEAKLYMQTKFSAANNINLYE